MSAEALQLDQDELKRGRAELGPDGDPSPRSIGDGGDPPPPPRDRETGGRRLPEPLPLWQRLLMFAAFLMLLAMILAVISNWANPKRRREG